MIQQQEAVPHKRKCACQVSALIVIVVDRKSGVEKSIKSLEIEYRYLYLEHSPTRGRMRTTLDIDIAALTKLLLQCAHSVPIIAIQYRLGPGYATGRYIM